MFSQQPGDVTEAPLNCLKAAAFNGAPEGRNVIPDRDQELDMMLIGWSRI
jgi:hypothetical protein